MNTNMEAVMETRELAAGMAESLSSFLKSVLSTSGGGEIVRSEAAQVFAKCFHAYQECDDETQEIIRDSVETINDREVDPDDRSLAMRTLIEALFPSYDDTLGIELEEAEKACAENTAEGAKAIEELDRQEAVFADRLDRIIREKGVSQTELAEKVGVRQSAISMMLKRNCRPQRRTVLKLAEGLNVRPEDLWPFADD